VWTILSGAPPASHGQLHSGLLLLRVFTGLVLAAGWFTRPAAAVMVVNFIVALVMVHRSLPFGSNIAPMAMCATSLVLVITGPGAFSLDGWLARRRRGYRARL